MIGVVLTTIGTFLEELATSIGKRQVARRQESVPTMGVLHLLMGVVILFGIAIVYPASFIFTSASLPYTIPRLLLELLQAHVTLTAIALADRSAFGFLRTLTIPILLGVDGVLGYSLHRGQVVGALLIVGALVVVMIGHGIRGRGAWLVLVSAVNAAGTISLYKYSITNFNSVVAEQLIGGVVLLAYFAVLAHVRAHEHPLAFLRRPVFLAESVAMGVGGVVEGFAYAFAPPSVVTSAKRATAVLWSIASGNHVFHESHLAVKAAAFVILCIGVMLLAVG